MTGLTGSRWSLLLPPFNEQVRNQDTWIRRAPEEVVEGAPCPAAVPLLSPCCPCVSGLETEGVCVTDMEQLLEAEAGFQAGQKEAPSTPGSLWVPCRCVGRSPLGQLSA